MAWQTKQRSSEEDEEGSREEADSFSRRGELKMSSTRMTSEETSSGMDDARLREVEHTSIVAQIAEEVAPTAPKHSFAAMARESIETTEGLDNFEATLPMSFNGSTLASSLHVDASSLGSSRIDLSHILILSNIYWRF